MSDECRQDAVSDISGLEMTGTGGETTPARHVLIIVRSNVTHDARVLKEARSLCDAGYRVTVLGLRTSARDTPLELRDCCTIRRVTTAALREEAPEASGASASDGKPSRSPYAGPIGELRHWAGRMRENRIYHAAALPLRPDVVISCDLTALPAGVWLKRDLGCRLVYDAHELYTEMSSSTGSIYRFLYTRTEARLIRRADAVMTVNSLIAEELSRRYNIHMPMVVMNGVHACLAPGPVHEPLRIFFQGVFARDRSLMPLVQQMHRVRGKATLTLQGFGEMEAELRQVVADSGLDDLVGFVDPCDPSEVVNCAHDYDVGVIAYRLKTLNQRLSSPNKLFDYLGAGLALLAVDAPVVRQIAGESGSAVLVDSDRLDSLWEVIMDLAESPDRVAEMKAASHALCARLTWDAQIQPLLTWLETGCSK